MSQGDLVDCKNVSVIIPTYDRLYAIKKTIYSYLNQKYIKEIIFVDDGITEGLCDFLHSLHCEHIRIKYIRHEKNKGAAAARNTGVKFCTEEFVLFGEDDVFLGEGYVEKLYDVITKKDYLNDIVSGQIVMLQENEELIEAHERYYSNDNTMINIFDPVSMTLNLGIKLGNEQVEVPFTHALFMTKKEKLINLKFDEYYFPGNGYREETDFQMNSFCEGNKAFILNSVLCFHMARKNVKTGGQRKNRVKQYFYCLKYNYHFFNKYYIKFHKRIGSEKKSLLWGHIAFSFTLFVKMFVIPIKKIYKVTKC